MPGLESILSAFLDTLPPDALLGVAHSGGCDSTALAGCLVSLGQTKRLVCLYADHDDRESGEMTREKAFLEDIWSKWNIRGRILPAPVPKGSGGFEAEARRVRYRVLEQAARKEGLAAVLLAHTRDDQMETLLMRLFRGRSDLGFGGIPGRRGLFRRPLLEVSRKELLEWLAENGQSWHEDSGNRGEGNLRARMRRLLVPALDQVFPAWRPALEAYARRWAERPAPPWRRHGDGWIMEGGVWRQLPVRDKIDALLRVLRPLPAGAQVSRRAVENLVAAGRPGNLAGWRLDFDATGVHWAPDVVIGEDFEYFLKVESGTSVLLRGRSLRIHREGPESKGYAIVSRMGGERWVLADPSADWDAVLKAAAPDSRRRPESLFLVAEGKVYGIFGTLTGGEDWVYRTGNGPLWEWE